MKATFELHFDSPETAKKACKVLSQNIPASKATLQCSANKSVLRATITAQGFTAMRAISTSLLRDARVFYDSLELMKK